MKEKDIIEFFDKRAPFWDKETVFDSKVLNRILDKGCITKGSKVLDVASGTGVLFPYYKKREVSLIVGVDLSPQMVKTAKKKFPDIDVICADAGKYEFSQEFDRIIIHNAYPHFPQPGKLISNLMLALEKGGRLTVAHSSSREEIEKCHNTAAKNVSLSLPDAYELAGFLGEFLSIDTVISDNSMYLVSGVKK